MPPYTETDSSERAEQQELRCRKRCSVSTSNRRSGLGAMTARDFSEMPARDQRVDDIGRRALRSRLGASRGRGLGNHAVLGKDRDRVAAGGAVVVAVDVAAVAS